MSHKFLFVFFVLILGRISAQRHELGLHLGASNLVGDIGGQGITQFIDPLPKLDEGNPVSLPLYVGVLYRKNLNPHQSLRVDIAYSHYDFRDMYSKSRARASRKYSGQNYMLEANILFEYYFRAVNQESEYAWSPYIFGGLGGFMFNGKNYIAKGDNQRSISADGISYTPHFSASVPFGLGFKQKFNYNWTLSFEAMFRSTFTDRLDFSDVRFTGNVPEETRGYLLFGNPNSTDWVNTLSVTLAYTFGRLPCYPD